MEETFFTQRVRFFLENNHPDLIKKLGTELDKFITARADLASILYESQIKKGVHQDAAQEAADAIFKEGLLFSRYSFIENILQDYHPEIFETKQKKGKLIDFIVDIIDNCEEVFSRYDTSDHYLCDDLMETELIGRIDSLVSK